MVRASLPADGEQSLEEALRLKDEERRFEEKCRSAYERLAALETSEKLIARLRRLRSGDRAGEVAIERRLADSDIAASTLAAAPRYLEDRSSRVAMAVVTALLAIGSPSVGVLAEILRGGNLAARRRACLALRLIRAPEAAGALLQFVTDSSAEIRAAVADALGEKYGDDQWELIVQSLRPLLRDVPPVRAAAARALGNLHIPAADVEEQVLRLLGDDEWTIRHRVAGLSAGAAAVLERYARRGDAIARVRSILALGCLGRDSPVLMEALLDDSEHIRVAALEALARTHQTFPQPAEGRSDLTDERWETLYQIDEAKRPSPEMRRVLIELQPGDVVRLWGARRREWQGPWQEVVVASGDHVALRTLDFDELEVVAMKLLERSGRLHPDPARLRILAAEKRERRTLLSGRQSNFYGSVVQYLDD